MDIRATAAKYLASRMRTCGEMREHLAKKGFSEDEIGEVIGEFRDFRYLDDEEYCIRQELAEKGVDREVIGFALEDYYDRDAELERALKQAEKTIAGKPVDDKMRGRLGRRLVSLGYSTDVVYKVIGICMRENDE